MRDDSKEEEPVTETRKLAFHKSNGGFDEISQFLQDTFSDEVSAQSPFIVTLPTQDSQTAAVVEHKKDLVREPELNQEHITAPVQVKEEPSVSEPTSEPSSNELDSLSVEELKRHQEEVDRKIREKQLAEKKAVIDQIVHVVETYKIPLDELYDALGGVKAKRRGVKAQPKYRDPASGAVWSGRGKEPVWIRGKKRDGFLIK